jgi:hypothetical protein
MDPLSTPPPLPPASDFKDRSGGLTALGVLEIIGGVGCALMIPMAVLGQAMVARQSGAPFEPAAVLTAVFQFILMAVALVWLGIGSIKARRWARAILLCLGWLGLAAGAVGLVAIIPTVGGMGEMMRQQGGREMPAGAVLVAQVMMLLITVVMYIVIPGVLVLFYRSIHVKHTCEVRDPVERWTDRVPLPLLAMCLVQAFGGAYFLLIVPQMGGAFPLAGIVVTGPLAYVLWIVGSALSLYCAWGFYRRQFLAWVAYLGFLVIFGVGSLVTFARVDMADYYRLAGMSAAQVKMIAASPLIRSGGILWVSGLTLALCGSYALYLLRYFRPQADAAAPAA